MASYKDLIVVSNDSNFQNRVLYALEMAAIAVMSENNQTAGHSQRVNYAKQILQDGNTASVPAARAVLTNFTIAGEADVAKAANGDYGIPDGDIQFQVNTIFSALAGVST